MLTETHVQQAHDRLVAIIVGEVPNPFGSTGAADVAVHSACDVLCWLLEHDHNTAFAENLGKIDAALARMGFALKHSAALRPRKPD